MNQHRDSSGQQSKEGQLSQNLKSVQYEGGATIDACTMDPCPMKAEHEGGKPEKCPQCGMEDEHNHEIA